MNELDLKEIIWYLQKRTSYLEDVILKGKYKSLGDSIEHNNFMERSDKYIKEVLDSIKEGE